MANNNKNQNKNHRPQQPPKQEDLQDAKPDAGKRDDSAAACEQNQVEASSENATVIQPDAKVSSASDDDFEAPKEKPTEPEVGDKVMYYGVQPAVQARVIKINDNKSIDLVYHAGETGLQTIENVARDKKKAGWDF